MAGSLESVLSRIPGIGGFEAARDQQQQAGMAELQQMGALQGILAQVEQQKAKALANQREQQFRGELAALGPNATQEQLAAVSAKYAPAADLLKSQQGSLDRKNALDVARENRAAQMDQQRTLQTERLDQQIELARQRSKDQQLSLAERNAARADMIRLTASLRPAPQEPLVPVQQEDGSVVYTPRSQASGLKVGSRVTDTNVSKQVQQLGRDLEKAGLPTMVAVTDQAGKLTPELAEWVTGPKSAVPDWIAPKEARDARQDVSKLFNITLKDRSGAAVTNQELERLKKEFGQGLFKNPDQLLTAIQRAQQIVKSHYQGIAASYGAPVLDSYNQNLVAVGGRGMLAPGAPPSSGGGWSVREKQ